MKIKDQVCDIYEYFLNKTVLAFNPLETKATCNNCNEKKYKPNLKCCTYQPFLPNFIVGKILLEGGEGAEIVRSKIHSREYCLPIGIVPPVRYQVEFNKNKDKHFGNKAQWLCSYYDTTNNLCSIWKNRGSVCTSFYCKSSYGKSGFHFWKSLENYLSYSEMVIMEEALVHLDFSPRQVSDLLGYIQRSSGSAAELKSDRVSLALWKKLWNGYHEDIENFYKKSYQIALEMDKKTFKEMSGAQGKAFEQTCLTALREL